jgi:hypothetical protein
MQNLAKALQFKKHSANLELRDHFDLGLRVDVVALETHSLDALVVLDQNAEVVERTAAEVIVTEIQHLDVGVEQGLAEESGSFIGDVVAGELEGF